MEACTAVHSTAYHIEKDRKGQAGPEHAG